MRKSENRRLEVEKTRRWKMDFFFKPRGVAVIGASANPAKGGHFILKNVINGFKGGIYPVNPGYTEIEGLTCYPSVSEVPDPLDLAIIFVPGPAVPSIVRECAERGIQGVMIEEAGFAESATTVNIFRNNLSLFAPKQEFVSGGRIVWAWWMPSTNRFFTLSSCPQSGKRGLPSGDVSLVVQSGMLSAGFLIDIMSHATMGISKACSLGNKVDVDECDILEYLIDDPETGVIGLYLESIQEWAALR